VSRGWKGFVVRNESPNGTPGKTEAESRLQLNQRRKSNREKNRGGVLTDRRGPVGRGGMRLETGDRETESALMEDTKEGGRGNREGDHLLIVGKRKKGVFPPRRGQNHCLDER